MFEAKMNAIYDRFVKRTKSKGNESFMTLSGRLLCLSICNVITSFLQIFIALGEMVIYGLSYLANDVSKDDKS